MSIKSLNAIIESMDFEVRQTQLGASSSTYCVILDKLFHISRCPSFLVYKMGMESACLIGLF